MATFDPTKYQQSPNGPLTPQTIQRLVALKERSGMAYATLGSKLGISGTFLHNLMNKDANIGTQHIERIANAIDLLENPDQAAEAPANAVGTLQHSFHLRPGLQVTIELPDDLTEREADRLARFVQSLPVA
ncbi:helix-turn-helix transcriptional regulator [Ensifer sp. ENS07]|uniref:helix-turn-helix domain-containing protein n=1 Tax=Ensifer sp. ENS07 TaxID=2769274 RepID=UPI00177FE109|nr:helix-turn-helix transcriptional regulator [Ensifer sp. ENS07]MBD9640884.1 helix-turn-helix transcriptional regulator [Ensifer sp. ENS07]